MSETANSTGTARPVLPLEPHFLSLSAEYQNIETKEIDENKKSELKRSYNPNIHGLFDTTTIREFLAVMSNDLGVFSQMPIFQLIPEGEFQFDEQKNEDRGMRVIDFPAPFFDNILNQNGKVMKLVRIDARSFFKGNPYCEVFKNHHRDKGDDPCSQFDSRVLLLFHPDLAAIDVNNSFDEYFQQLQEICRAYNPEAGEQYVNQYIQNTKHRRVYLRYTCSLSGFTEYAFPLYHNGHIIAAIMMGQRIRKGEKNSLSFPFVKDPDYLEALKPKFDEIIDISEENYKDIVRSVNPDSHLRFFSKDSFLDLSPETLEKIFCRLSVLENRIDAEIDKRLREMVSSEFDSIERDFRDELRKNNVQDDNDYNSLDDIRKSYQTTLNSTLTRICDRFNSGGDIFVYSKQQKIATSASDSKIFNIIGRSRGSQNVENQMIFGCGTDFSRLAADNIPLWLEQKMQIKSVGEHIYPINDSSEDFLVLIRESFSRESLYPEQYGVFSKQLHSFYHTLIEPYNILQASKLGKNLEVSMRITVHEASNVIPPVSDTIARELELDDAKEDMYITNPKDINIRKKPLWDVYIRLKTLDKVYKRSTIPFKDITPDQDYHDLHRLVYSVKSLFDVKAGDEVYRKGNIEVRMDSVFNKVRVYTDDELFTHIFFNLLDNAVKYGYMGSNIYIDVDSKDRDKIGVNTSEVETIQISVTSYGEEITDEDKAHITELFKRCNKADEVEGMGVGLFIVEKMCKALGYQLDVDSEQVSEQNVPAHFWYKLRKPVNDGIGEIKNYLDKTIPDDVINRVVNRCAGWKIGFTEMSAIISNPTWKNKFTIRLRSNNKYKTLLKRN